MTGERVARRLAAILAADVVGYSRLMGRDENGTLSRLKTHRTERLEPTLARYGGRLVKLTGDGALVEFPSAVDALAAAIEFQQAMADVNRDQPEDTAIVFRIGVHLGDLIVEGDDLYGDGVNIAARLESEAPSGGIVISRTVHEAVAGRLKASFDDLGNLALKNIERPVQAFGVSWAAAEWKSAAPTVSAAAPAAVNAALTLPDKPSIAVLPFENMSGDPEQEYFADGMVEDIITALSRFRSLFVIARNSSFAYKGKAVDTKRVSRELGVRYVLEGSVRKASGKVRITGQLIDSETGAHLWADRFDGSLEDIFDLQDQVTTSVVGAIAPKLEKAEMERAKRKPVESLDAYDCFLRGMANVYKHSIESWQTALQLFYQAIALDPEFAMPYAMAARSYAAFRHYGKIADKDWVEAETRRLALRVSTIGRDDAHAVCWAGYSLGFVCGDMDAALELIDQGLAMNHNLAVGWQLRALVSIWQGRYEAAREQIARATRLNPLDPEVSRSEHAMSLISLGQGKYDHATNWATKALVHQPNWPPAMWVLAAANALAGNVGGAQKIIALIRGLDPLAGISQCRQVFAYGHPPFLETMIEGLRLAGLAEEGGVDSTPSSRPMR